MTDSDTSALDAPASSATRHQPAVRILINDGPPGCGKSRYLRRLMIQQPRRYLYALPTTLLLNEALESIADMAGGAGRQPPPMVSITSKVPGAGKVARRLEECAADHATAPHVVVLCTHEGLMSADLQAFVGWTLFIDEVPTIVEGGVFTTPLSAPLFNSLYRLDPVDDTGWSVLTARASEPSAQTIAKDTLLRPLARLHRRALESSRPVLADLTDWSEMGEREAWSWWSMWEIGKTAAFAEVRLVGNAVGSSLTKQAIEQWTKVDGDVQFEHFDLPSFSVVRASRKATVHYFTEHPGNTVFWERDEGRRCVAAIAAWVKQHAPANDLLWSGNKTIIEQWSAAGVHGKQEQPMLAGINAYRNLTWAAILFSAKMQPSERVAMRLFEPDAEAVRRSREFETILQFAFRTALREEAFNGHIHIVVYDRQQAEFIAAFLQERGLAEAEAQYEDIGINSITPSQSRPQLNQAHGPAAAGGRSVSPTPRTAAQRQQESRARRRAAKTAGVPVAPAKRGRPRKGG